MKTAIVPLLAALLCSLRPSGAFAPPKGGLALERGSCHGGTTSAPATRLFSVAAARPITEGIAKTTTVEGTGRPVRPGDVVVVKYFCSAAGSDRAFARSERQRIVAGDGTMIRGWDAGIRTMREGERASIYISDPRFAYGEVGVPPFVPPNAEVEIDVEVISVEEAMGMAAGADASALDAMGMDGPVSRPRTPGAIAAAYEQKMKYKAENAPEEKEGIAGFVDWIRNSYFFGLFEGETGQEAPWYLKPSITFPIAFLVVGAAFWASLVGGAISERGMPTTDELDELIVSSDMIRASIAVALNMIQV